MRLHHSRALYIPAFGTMTRTFLCLALVLLSPNLALAQAAEPPRIPSAEEDLAWLERRLDAEAAGSRRIQASRGPALQFNQLGEHIGQTLDVELRDGRRRLGRLEAAEGGQARLRVPLAAGDYVLEFSASEVARIGHPAAR